MRGNEFVSGFSISSLSLLPILQEVSPWKIVGSYLIWNHLLYALKNNNKKKHIANLFVFLLLADRRVCRKRRFLRTTPCDGGVHWLKDNLTLFLSSRICGMLGEGSLQYRETFFKRKNTNTQCPTPPLHSHNSLCNLYFNLILRLEIFFFFRR